MWPTLQVSGPEEERVRSREPGSGSGGGHSGRWVQAGRCRCRDVDVSVACTCRPQTQTGIQMWKSAFYVSAYMCWVGGVLYQGSAECGQHQFGSGRMWAVPFPSYFSISFPFSAFGTFPFNANGK